MSEITFVPYLLIGCAAGFLGGLLGIGGGVIVVPALIFLFEYLNLFPANVFPENTAVLCALATSMASIVFTTGAAAVTQWRHNAIAWDIVKHWVVYLIVGSFAASFIAKLLPVGAIKLFVASFILLVAVMMLTSFQPDPNRKSPRKSVTALLATGGGFISSLCGIGGGNVIVPTLLFFNTQIVRATAVASTLGIAISVAGTSGYILNGWGSSIPGAIGFVYLPALIPIAIACACAAPLGVHVAHRVKPNLLRTCFGIITLCVAARMYYVAFVG